MNKYCCKKPVITRNEWKSQCKDSPLPAVHFKLHEVFISAHVLFADFLYFSIPDSESYHSNDMSCFSCFELKASPQAS